MSESYNDTIERIKPIATRYQSLKKLEYPLNTMRILEDLGYFIIKAPAPNNLSGFYMKKDAYPFIFVNSNHTYGRQNFSLWHEVYHHVMDHKNGISDFNANSLEEREAEIFAGLILLPDSEIDNYKDIDFSKPLEIARLSVKYAMSFNGVLIRLVQHGSLEWDDYHEIKKLSKVGNADELNELYESSGLDKNVITPTKTVQISSNIMDTLEQNYNSNKITGEKINEIISMIEGLGHE